MDKLTSVELQRLLFLLTYKRHHKRLRVILLELNDLNSWVGETIDDVEFTAITGNTISIGYTYYKADEFAHSELSMDHHFHGYIPTHVELTIVHALKSYAKRVSSSIGKIVPVVVVPPPSLIK